MPDLPTLEQIAELPPLHRATIPTEYLDEMGHMNVMWYTYLFGQAVREMLIGVGFNRQYVETNQAGTFALEKHVRYLDETHVGDQVAVYVRVAGRSEKRFHLVQFMVNETRQRLASIMETVGTHVDLRIRRSSPFPESIAAAFDDLIASHSELQWDSPVCGVMKP